MERIFFRILPVLALFAAGGIVWMIPAPLNIRPETWHLFAIFITTIAAILFNLLPIVTAAIIALAAAVLSGVIEPSKAYAGFSESFILLIVAAFLVSYAVHKSGLGKRLSLHIIRRFGHSTASISRRTTSA